MVPRVLSAASCRLALVNSMVIPLPGQLARAASGERIHLFLAQPVWCAQIVGGVMRAVRCPYTTDSCRITQTLDLGEGGIIRRFPCITVWIPSARTNALSVLTERIPSTSAASDIVSRQWASRPLSVSSSFLVAAAMSPRADGPQVIAPFGHHRVPSAPMRAWDHRPLQPCGKPHLRCARHLSRTALHMIHTHTHPAAAQWYARAVQWTACAVALPCDRA